MFALPLAGALLLAGCGGGTGGGAATTDRQAAQSIAAGEPSPSAPPDSAPFIAMAQQASCADLHNRLYVIDQQYVFWDRSGRCGDNSYAYGLYGKNPDTLLCSQADSIAGPRTSCTDDKARALFDVIVKNLEPSDLGLGSGHKVEPIPFKSPVVPYTDIDRRALSGITTPQNMVIKDDKTWATVWAQHAGTEALPKVDFSQDMVLGVFGSGTDGCAYTRITGVAYKDGTLIVTRVDGSSADANTACTMMITRPAHLIMVARTEAPVEFTQAAKALP